jgi:GAF domain-containing protein
MMINRFQLNRISTWPLRFKLAFGLVTAALVELAMVGFSLIIVNRTLPDTADQMIVNQLAVVLMAVWLPGLTLLALSWALMNVYVILPIQRLRFNLRQLLEGGYNRGIPEIGTSDEIGQIGQQISTVYQQFNQVQTLLTDSEAKRARELTAVQDITRAVVSIRDAKQVAERVIALLCERFPTIYHAQIFLLDDAGDSAILEASSGSLGKQLLERGEHWAVGSRSLIGQVTSRHTALVALDIANHPVYPANPLLPDSQAECALPIQVGPSLLGALDLHSRESQAFGEAELSLFQMVADQLANSIYNAQLFEELEMRVNQVEALNQQLTGKAWRTYVQNRIPAAGAVSRPEPLSALQEQAISTGQVATHDEADQTRMAVPIQLRGATLGAVEWTIPSSSYSAALGSLAQDLATRLALTADNVRLLDQTQRQVQRERLINEISAQLTQQSDVAEILQTAVRELGQALFVSQAVIEIDKEQT